jgi:hypothetical protein
LKQLLLITMLALSGLLLSACAGPQADLSSAAAPLVKKPAESSPIALEAVMAGNEAALSFANDTRDFLEGDAFIKFVSDARTRDQEAIDKKEIQTLVAGVNGLKQALGDQSPLTNEPKTNDQWQGIDQISYQEPQEPVKEPSNLLDDSGRYFSKDGGFSIVFPTGWKIEAGPGLFGTNVVTAAEELEMDGYEGLGFCGGLTIVDEKIPQKLSLEEYLQANLALMKLIIPDFQEGEITDSKVGGKHAKRLAYSYRLGDVKVNAFVYLTLNGGRGYAITAFEHDEHFPTYWDEFEAAIKTFRFEESSS